MNCTKTWCLFLFSEFTGLSRFELRNVMKIIFPACFSTWWNFASATFFLYHSPSLRDRHASDSVILFSIWNPNLMEVNIILWSLNTCHWYLRLYAFIFNYYFYEMICLSCSSFLVSFDENTLTFFAHNKLIKLINLSTCKLIKLIKHSKQSENNQKCKFMEK